MIMENLLSDWRPYEYKKLNVAIQTKQCSYCNFILVQRIIYSFRYFVKGTNPHFIFIYLEGGGGILLISGLKFVC
jgi:hypothetical protein